MNLDKDTAFTHKVLDVLALRTKVAVQNIVNQNTPGFKRRQVHFEEALRDAQVRGTDVREVQPKVVKLDTGEPGENNVIVEDELSQLKKLEILHQLFVRRAKGYFDHVNKAIFGR